MVALDNAFQSLVAFKSVDGFSSLLELGLLLHLHSSLSLSDVQKSHRMVACELMGILQSMASTEAKYRDHIYRYPVSRTSDGIVTRESASDFGVIDKRLCILSVKVNI